MQALRPTCNSCCLRLQVFFVSNLLQSTSGKTGELWLINLESKALREIRPCRQISTPNGAFRYGDKVALLLQASSILSPNTLLWNGV